MPHVDATSMHDVYKVARAAWHNCARVQLSCKGRDGSEVEVVLRGASYSSIMHLVVVTPKEAVGRGAADGDTML